MEETEERSRVKIAEVIARERKKHNMTQKELGDTLHISPQAVSKWETGLAEPDSETILKMCEIFGITPNEMYGQPQQAADEHAADAQAQPPVPEQDKTAATEPIVILGYCEQCKKPLHSTDEYEVYGTRTTRTLCETCIEENHALSIIAKYRDHAHETKKSFLIGGIAGGVGLIALLITLFVGDPFGSAAVNCVLSIIGGVVLFTFFTQMFWDESAVQELFGFFNHSFRLPGIIFTLDIGGVLFLIFGKIFLAILGAIASVLFFLIGLIITPIASVFIFPFALLVRCVKGKKRKADASAVENK